MPGDVRHEAVVHRDPAMLVQRDADRFEPQPRGVGPPADRYQDNIGR